MILAAEVVLGLASLFGGSIILSAVIAAIVFIAAKDVILFPAGALILIGGPVTIISAAARLIEVGIILFAAVVPAAVLFVAVGHLIHTVLEIIRVDLVVAAFVIVIVSVTIA